MKNLIIAATLSLACAVASAQTLAQKEAMINKAFTTETRCLDMAGIAAMYAEKRQEGAGEALLLKVTSVGHWSDRVYRDIIKLIYTMELDGPMARQLVYTKCVTGAYNPTVKEIEEGMRKK